MDNFNLNQDLNLLSHEFVNKKIKQENNDTKILIKKLDTNYEIL